MTSAAVYGVDFSAHAQNSGYRTWLTKAIPRGNETLDVEWTKCATDALDGDPRRRDATLSELVDFLGSREGAAVGLDFPFSLPKSVVKEYFGTDDWSEFVREFPGDWDSPTEMFDEVNDGDFEVRRETDRVHLGQPPTGWRIKTQTFHGIRDVLAPLVKEHDARVSSLHLDGSGPLVLETYPSAVFSELDLFGDGYKDVPEESRGRREANVRGLQSRHVSLSGIYAETARHNDDALDSVAAAYAAWHPRSEIDTVVDRGVEGRIYV